MGLSALAPRYLTENHTGSNIQHHLVPLLRQSVYSRLAGYPDTNDADRLPQEPALRLVVSRPASEKRAAARTTVGRFETELLASEENRRGLALFVLAYNLANFLRRSAVPESIRHWSLRSIQVKLIKIGARVVRHARQLVFQMAEVAVPKELFAQILQRIWALAAAPG